jgi:hypothetical protein
MKKVKYLSVLALPLLLFFSSCEKTSCVSGEGTVVTRSISVADFNRIDMASAENVDIFYGNEQQVLAIGHQNIIDRISRTVSNGLWKMELEDDCYNNYSLSYIITIPKLDLVKISGSGDVTINEFQNQNDLNIQITGSGDVTINQFENTGDLDVTISGSGDVTSTNMLTQFNSLDVTIPGSGNFFGFPSKVNKCYVNIAGSGDCQVYSKDLLNVMISGSGDVYYKGNPIIYTNISGSGNVYNSN